MQPALTVRAVSKTYRCGARAGAVSTAALSDVSFDVHAGEIIGLVGKPRAGKSTLLLCLAGLLRSDSGTITWFGEQVTGRHVPRGLTYIPQRAGYYSFLTVREALEYYATLHDLTSAHRASQVECALRDVALDVHAARKVSHLSSGMLQRLGLAQALIGTPRAILLDETLTGEGLLFDRMVVALLTRLSRQGIVIIHAAPNPVELHRIASRVINLSEGRLTVARNEAVADTPAKQLPFELPAGTPRLVAEHH